jgi:hypothetical protein
VKRYSRNGSEGEVLEAKTAGVESKSRVYFADHLKAALVSLVVLHHISITYGASRSFYYIEPATDSAAAGLLSLFTV